MVTSRRVRRDPAAPQSPRTQYRTPSNRTARAASPPTRAYDDDERGRLSRSANAGRMFIPSALTILAVCAGLTAMRAALNGQIEVALALLVAAAVLDGIDGRVARLIGATSRMGAEIDSLADAINFGVVPAMIVYIHLMDGTDFGWALALVYCCAIVLRLARFNTLLDDDDAPAFTKDFFVGVPAPAAAIGTLLPVGLSQQFGDGWWTSVPAVGGWLVLMAFLAISRVPTSSLKTASIRPRALVLLLIGVAGAAALLLTYPYYLMILLIGAYLLHIPFAWRNQRWVECHPEHWDAHPAERRAERRATRTENRLRGGSRLRGNGRLRRRPVLKPQGRLGLNKPVRPARPATDPGDDADAPATNAPSEPSGE